MEDKDLPEGWVDWNTLEMDQLVDHLRNEFQFHSTGTAFAVMKLIGFYEENKERKFSVDEIKKYIYSKDSLGDILYYLNEENIIEANSDEAS